MNEMTVTEVYTVDEVIQVQPSMRHTPLSHALRKTLEIGNLCNNGRRTDDGTFVGQSTDVALLNVLDVFGMSDARKVCLTWPPTSTIHPLSSSRHLQ